MAFCWSLAIDPTTVERAFKHQAAEGLDTGHGHVREARGELGRRDIVDDLVKRGALRLVHGDRVAHKQRELLSMAGVGADGVFLPHAEDGDHQLVTSTKLLPVRRREARPAIVVESHHDDLGRVA